jgi:MFS family permease
MSSRLPRRDFALVFLVLLSVAAGNTALQSVLPAIGRRIAMPDMLVAIIFSFSALLWTLSAPYWARASDRRGRKRLIQVGMTGFAVSTLACGFVIHAGLAGWIGPILTFALFALARALFGLFGSASNPAAQAYVAGRTSPQERTQALAMLGSAFGLGTILGPAIAPSFVLPGVGLSGPLFAFAAIAVLVLVLVSRMLPADSGLTAAGAAASMPTLGAAPLGAHVTAASNHPAKRLSWRDPRIRPFMYFGLGVGSVQAATGQTIGFLVIDRVSESPEAAQPLIGVVFMAGAAATLLVQWGLIRMLDLKPGTLMRWGCAIAAAGTLGTALARDFHGIVVAFALTCIGYGFARPGFTAGSSLAVGRRDQGAVAGAITAVNGSGFIAAPAIGVGLYELDWHLPYLVGAVGLVALLAYAFLDPQLRRADDLVEEEARADGGGPHI